MQSTLRTYLKEINKDILHIRKSTAPLTQVGDLCSQSNQPILFENIKGFPGWNICDRLVSDRQRQAVALKTAPEKVVAHLAEKINQGPGKFKIVKTGPVKEKKLSGKQASFTKIPFCVHSPDDGGPYIGSGMCVVRDPDTGHQNVAMHRIHIKRPSHAAVSLFSPHSNAILQKYAERKLPAPMAVVIGHHPCFEIATNYFGPHDTWNEHELAATLLNETVEMVRCEHSDIVVPAHAEMILECEIKPGVTEMEGPFAEFHNYYASEPGPKPRLDLKAISMRKDAIYRHLNATPYTDHQPLAVLPGEARLFDQLKRKGIQIHDVYIPPWGGLFVTIIQMTGLIEEQVREALMMTLFSPVLLFTKVAIAVDDDIDIYDAQDIIYALGTRVNPEKDIIQINGTQGIPYDLSFPLIPEAPPLRRGGKLAIDATKPPLTRKNQRDKFDRVSTKGWGKVSLKDFI
jgi:2,5-furandicarboxylate decarboxylase 1